MEPIFTLAEDTQHDEIYETINILVNEFALLIKMKKDPRDLQHRELIDCHKRALGDACVKLTPVLKDVILVHTSDAGLFKKHKHITNLPDQLSNYSLSVTYHRPWMLHKTKVAMKLVTVKLSVPVIVTFQLTL